MKHARNTRRKTNDNRIRTNFWGLVGELSNLTADDNLVVAAVRSIFTTHTVRMGPSLAPVRVASADWPARLQQQRPHRQRGR